MKRRVRLGVACLVIGWVVAACGKIGDPVPAQVVLPPTVQDLTVENLVGRNRLSFSLPSEADWVEVYRQCNPRGSEETFNRLAQVSPDELAEATPPGRYSWLDRSPSATPCRYVLRFVDETGLRSQYSNVAP